MHSTMPTVSAIVPATDTPAALSRCRTAIASAAEPPEEVVVVTEPAGAAPAAARNLGARRAGGDVLCFIDADVAVHPDAFARVRAAFASDPGLSAVFGAYDDAPTAAGAVSGFRNLLHHHVHAGAAGDAVTFWAGLGAVRRDAFLAAGGFDADRYRRSSIEDIELGLRLAAGGGRLVLDPEIRGTHLKAWTLRSMIATDFTRRGVPWVELLLETRDRGAPRRALNLGWRHRASAVAVLAGLAAILAGRRPAAAGALAGFLWLNRDFYGLLARRRGAGEALLGIGLHATHHLVGIAAVPAGAVTHAARRHRRARSAPD